MHLQSLPLAVTDVLRVAHANSVLTLSFGIDATMARVHRFVHRAHTPDQPYETFLSLSYNPTPERRPAHSITFTYYDELALHDVDIYFIYFPTPLGLQVWSKWCIVDILALDPTRVIPSRLFVPYADNPIRSELALGQTDMLPIFFIGTNDVVGVPIAAGADYNFLPDVYTRIPAEKTSMKVILNLYNYPSYEGQIQLRTANNLPNVTIRRLAQLVAGRVRACIHRAAVKDAELSYFPQPRWRMGNGPGRIAIEDIILLGVIFVSPGKITPLLQVRSGHVF